MNAFRTEVDCRKPPLYVERLLCKICSLILTLVTINPSGFQEIWFKAEIKADVQSCLWEPLSFFQMKPWECKVLRQGMSLFAFNKGLWTQKAMR